jgi:hypothetical protein
VGDGVTVGVSVGDGVAVGVSVGAVGVFVGGAVTMNGVETQYTNWPSKPSQAMNLCSPGGASGGTYTVVFQSPLGGVGVKVPSGFPSRVSQKIRWLGY